MKVNDHSGHYKAFVNELKHNPAQILQICFRDHGVVWCRLYDWMQRRHVSLKKFKRHTGETLERRVRMRSMRDVSNFVN